VAEQEVRWGNGGNEQVIVHFSMEVGNANHHLRTDVFVHHRIISTIKRVEFISDRMSYIRLILLIVLIDLIGLEVNTETTKYMFMSHHQNARQI
jgi:hypothetical protein